MDATCIDIDPIANSVRFLVGVLFFGICDGQLPFKYQMRREATVRVRIVMGISVAKVSAVPGLPWILPTYGPSVQVKT